MCKPLRWVILLLAAHVQASETYQIETVVSGLNHPWSLAFLPDGRLLITERAGQLRIVEADGQLNPQPVKGLPQVFGHAQAGLLDVALDPEYPEQPWIYFSYAHGDMHANNTRVARAQLSNGELQELQVLFTAQPLKAGAAHYGGRLTFLADNSLVLGLGDAFDQREQAQNLSNHLGKIVRINRDGSIPSDNPFIAHKGAKAEVYSYGHRNVQGVYFDRASAQLYSHEHGPRGGDELNLIEPGNNYGWPLTTFGVDYTGAQVTPYTELPGLAAPLLHWTPSVAPSALTRYQGALFKEWQGDLFASTLAERSVRRIRLENGQPVAEQVLFSELGERIRDIKEGPDGALYLLTDSPNGRLLRVVPTP